MDRLAWTGSDIQLDNFTMPATGIERGWLCLTQDIKMHASTAEVYDGRPTITGVVYLKTIGNYLENSQSLKPLASF